MNCPDCGRRIATQDDEECHNTGACGCADASSLCWKAWGGCVSPYDCAAQAPSPAVGNASKGDE